MAQSSEELRAELAKTRARIEQDIDALQGKVRGMAGVRDILQPHAVPLVVGGVGLILLVIGFLSRRREEQQPPLPPVGSRRRRVAEAVTQAEEEGLLNEELRRLIIGMLTTQGMKWLQEYAEEEGQRLAREAQQAAMQHAQRAGDSLQDSAQRAGRAAQQTAERVQEGARRASEQATQQLDAATGRTMEVADRTGSRVASIRQVVTDRLQQLSSRAMMPMPEQSGNKGTAAELQEQAIVAVAGSSGPEAASSTTKTAEPARQKGWNPLRRVRR